MNQIKKHNENTFEKLKIVNADGVEYWEARELYKILEYQSWNKFTNVINKAITACNNSEYKVDNHFSQVGKIVKTGVSEKKIVDYYLSRYACYLIVQNGDSRKSVIALGQSYFATQTRKQEINEMEYAELSETEKRFHNRKLTKRKNKNLNKAAKNAGVKNFDRFHNAVIKDYMLEKLLMI